MLFVILLVVFIALGVFLGVLFNKAVISKFSEIDRKGNYIITVVVFVLITVVMFSVVFAKFSINSSVNFYSNELEQYLLDNHSNMELVRTGINMELVNQDITKLNNAVTQLKDALWPHASELGLTRNVYNLLANYVTREIQKNLLVVNAAGHVANSFTDENNFLTISSIMNGLRLRIAFIINIITIIVVVICSLILIIYILASLSTARKEKLRAQS